MSSSNEMSKRKLNLEGGYQHSSRRKVWIQKRWKRALQAIKTTRDDKKNSNGVDDDSHSFEEENDCNHDFVTTSKCKPCFYCDQCVNDNEDDGLKCLKCRIVIHMDCQSALTQKKELRKQKSGTGDEFENYVEAGKKNVDPIYLALKEANKMAAQRKQATNPTNEFPRGSSQTRDQTPSSSEITSRSSSQSKVTSLSLSSFVTSPVSQNAATKSFLNSPTSLTESVHSAPNLLLQKSIDYHEDGNPAKKLVQPIQPIKACARRAPKLDMKMKSLSLDCSESTVTHSRGACNGTTTPVMVNRHTLRVPPCQDKSFESSEGTARSSLSCSPCPSPRCGSTLTLPSNSFAVTHDYYAKFPEEIDLRIGEHVMLFDNSDPDWWQGQNTAGRMGIFPATCVAHIHSNERIMQVVQNVCLMDGSKNLRLYRDQIVFAPLDPQVTDGLVIIRTERDHRINCPTRYIMNLSD